MHLFADGITRHEAAWLLYFLISRKFTALAAMQDTIRHYRNWSRDVRIPPLPANVRCPKASRPSATSGCHNFHERVANDEVRFAQVRRARITLADSHLSDAAPALIVV